MTNRIYHRHKMPITIPPHDSTSSENCNPQSSEPSHLLADITRSRSPHIWQRCQRARRLLWLWSSQGIWHPWRMSVAQEQGSKFHVECVSSSRGDQGGEKNRCLSRKSMERRFASANERWELTLSLCLRASAAGVGFRRSTARTWRDHGNGKRKPQEWNDYFRGENEWGGNENWPFSRHQATCYTYNVSADFLEF